MFYRKALMEIKEHLMPVLRKLGLEAVYGRSADGLEVHFWSLDRAWVSSVSLEILGPHLSKEAEASWANTTVRVEHFEMERVGDNGWKNLNFFGTQDVRPKPGPADAVLAAIANRIRCGRMMPASEDIPYISNDHLPEAYRRIKEILPRRTRVNVERRDGVDGLSYATRAGAQMWLSIDAFAQQEEIAILYKDGVEIDRSYSLSPDDVCYVVEENFDFDPRRRDW